MKTLHTNLYTDFAEHLLCHALYSMANMTATTTSAFRNRFNGISIVREPNGEVVIQGSNDYWSDSKSFVNKFDSTCALIWLARTIKHIILQTEKSATWKRDSEDLVNVFIFKHGKDTIIPTVKDLYLIYDVLIARKKLEAKYDKQMIAKVKGFERNALETELEVARRTETAALKEKWEKTIHDLDPTKWDSKARAEVQAKVAALQQTLNAEWIAKMNNAKQEYSAELKKLNEQMAAFSTVESFPFS